MFSEPYNLCYCYTYVLLQARQFLVLWRKTSTLHWDLWISWSSVLLLVQLPWRNLNCKAKFGSLWISGTVQEVCTQRETNSKLQISLLSCRLGSLFAPIPLLSWYVSSWFSLLPKDEFTATLKWFILAWGSAAQSGVHQKWFMLTWLRSGHSPSFSFQFTTFKLDDIHLWLEARVFSIDAWNLQPYFCIYFSYKVQQFPGRR